MFLSYYHIYIEVKVKYIYILCIMNYHNLYQSIIHNSRLRFISKSNTRKQWIKDYKKINSDYIEVHHIIPKCLGGTDNTSNFCALSAKEHYIVHKLLWKMNPSNSKLLYAYNMLSSNTKTAKEYKIIKEQCALHNTGTLNPFYNKVHSINSKIQMIQSMIINKTIKPLAFNGRIYLSIRCASVLFSCQKRAITRHVDKGEYDSYYIDSINVPDYIWQLSPTYDDITTHTRIYNELIHSSKSVAMSTKYNKSINLLKSYIESECNSLDEYAKSIGMSDCGLAYQFKRFPMYNEISNGCKQFTKEKAIELLQSIAS